MARRARQKLLDSRRLRKLVMTASFLLFMACILGAALSLSVNGLDLRTIGILSVSVPFAKLGFDAIPADGDAVGRIADEEIDYDLLKREARRDKEREKKRAATRLRWERAERERQEREGEAREGDGAA